MAPPELRREIHWPVPTRTRHHEYTVTDMCYLIEAKTPCSGCTLIGVQAPDKGVIVDFSLPVAAEDRYRTNTPFITNVLEGEVRQNTNLITLMGGEPLTVKGFDQVVRWIAQHDTLNGLIYTSSAYFFKPSGEPNRQYHLYEDAGLFSPEFGYVKASVDMLIRDERELPPKEHPLRGEMFKSLYGLKLAELAAGRGHSIAIHQTMKDTTIDQTIPLYEWAKKRGIRFYMCPMIWAPYVSRGRPETFYARHLTDDHRAKLKDITDYLIADTVDRHEKGKQRIFVPSSAFTRLIPEYGPMNTLNCRVHRQGKQPNTHDIHPNGQERWCIAQNTAEDGQNCAGCHYIGIDRGESDYWNFEDLARLKPGDVRFLNADVWVKNPNYDSTGRDLFFDVGGKPLL